MNQQKCTKTDLLCHLQRSAVQTKGNWDDSDHAVHFFLHLQHKCISHTAVTQHKR
uniref:Uncharacterized protein n=1 Tax=Anopheles quadriannulatus TaxID=34691 RepID=A0A182XQB1_ANOQN